MDTDEQGYGKEIEQERTERTEVGRKRTQRTRKIANSMGEERAQNGWRWEKVGWEAGFSHLKWARDGKMAQLFPLRDRLFAPFPTFFDASG